MTLAQLDALVTARRRMHIRQQQGEQRMGTAQDLLGVARVRSMGGDGT